MKCKQNDWGIDLVGGAKSSSYNDNHIIVSTYLNKIQKMMKKKFDYFKTFQSILNWDI